MAATGVFTRRGLFNSSFTGVSFLIVPIGLGWMIATSIVRLRRMRAAAQDERELAPVLNLL